MNKQRKDYIANLYQTYHNADIEQPDRLNRWCSIEPESAEFLAFLVLAKQAKKLLEIGTSGGYSSLWLADAAEQTSGHLITLEIEKERRQTALKHLTTTRLSDVATALCTDAGTFLQNSQDSYDFIFLDAERPAYPVYWTYLKTCLQAPGSVLVVDNVLSHAEQVQDFIALINADNDFEQTVLPIGAGLLLVVKM
ncbi:methyltransferase [Aggregatibacter actinomycetemcomitans]|uniref:O-methyltransferase n=1 Tax=Aggregatibacter actinomycetemcomitans TaxID=714 RepID=UPI0011D6B536|nr:class I SAM-dependent methyltransferase [Aggregatibacter actinomycetemcomitans]TYB22303.1 methyltransferase [Aggregatibacter actinomycetemcomitans]